ncbi:MAG TPA: SDR family oxidoreductase [Candidatus Binatia bacterium]|jgi:3-oxoacyl-[acyl-carrier protein] reductase|nr:SDR family oxidoreductase [Candidatus Binatia bacterium]
MALLDGKVVIVTGGGHGIGKAYCLGIAREGGIVVAADVDAKAAEGVAKAILDSGGKALATKVDVANFESCQAMAQKALDAYGQIDGLVNNAAIFMSVPAEKGSWQDIPEEAWDRMMAVNVKGLWHCSKAVVPAMQRRKQGSVVNISSNMAFNGGLTMMHYVTSKAAVVGFSRVLARELGPDNIRVNTLAPGATMSEEKATETALKNYERSASTRILKRIEQPEDLVGTALYLLSDLSAFVTGQTILVNGGAVLH